MVQAEGSPYAWPYDGNLRPDNTCLLIIDMQARRDCQQPCRRPCRGAATPAPGGSALA
jgi:hypothetical protein